MNAWRSGFFYFVAVKRINIQKVMDIISSQRYKKFPLTIRMIASILIVTFLFQDIAWAHPDPFIKQSSKSSTLAPDTFLKKQGSREAASITFLEYLIEHHPKFHENISLTAVEHILGSSPIQEWMKDNNASYECGRDESGLPTEIIITTPPGYRVRYYDPAIERESGQYTYGAMRVGDNIYKQIIEVKALPAPSGPAAIAGLEKESSAKGFKRRLGIVLALTALACLVVSSIYLTGGFDWYFQIKGAIPPHTLFYAPAALLDAVTGIVMWSTSDIAGQYLNQGRNIRFKQTARLGLYGIFQGVATHLLYNSLNILPSFSWNIAFVTLPVVAGIIVMSVVINKFIVPARYKTARKAMQLAMVGSVWVTVYVLLSVLPGLFARKLLRTFVALSGGFIISLVLARKTTVGRRETKEFSKMTMEERQKWENAEWEKTGDLFLYKFILAPLKTFIVSNELPEPVRVLSEQVWDYVTTIFSSYIMNRKDSLMVKRLIKFLPKIRDAIKQFLSKVYKNRKIITVALITMAAVSLILYFALPEQAPGDIWKSYISFAILIPMGAFWGEAIKLKDGGIAKLRYEHFNKRKLIVIASLAIIFFGWFWPLTYIWWLDVLPKFLLGLADQIFTGPISLVLIFLVTELCENIFSGKKGWSLVNDVIRPQLPNLRLTLIVAFIIWTVIHGALFSIPIPFYLKTIIIAGLAQPAFSLFSFYMVHNKADEDRQIVLKSWAKAALPLVLFHNLIIFKLFTNWPLLLIGAALYIAVLWFGFKKVKSTVPPPEEPKGAGNIKGVEKPASPIKTRAMFDYVKKKEINTHRNALYAIVSALMLQIFFMGAYFGLHVITLNQLQACIFLWGVLFSFVSLWGYFKYIKLSKLVSQGSEGLMDAASIKDAGALSVYIDSIIDDINNLNQVLKLFPEKDAPASLPYIIEHSRRFRRIFFEPLYELFFARLSEDFDGSEKFVNHYRKVIGYWGAPQLRQEMDEAKERSKMLELFSRIKVNDKTKNASIEFYGLLLFCLTSNIGFTSHLYSEFMKTRPVCELSLARKGISYHIRGDSVVHLYSKNEDVLFEGGERIYRRLIYAFAGVEVKPTPQEDIPEKIQDIRNFIMNLEEKLKDLRLSPEFKEVTEKTLRKAKNKAKVKMALAILESQANNRLFPLEERKAIQERLARFNSVGTVVGLEMSTNLLFSDPQRNIARLIHAGRDRHVLYLSNHYLDGLDMDKRDHVRELAAWLNYGQRFLHLHDTMEEEGASPEDTQRLLSDFTLHFLDKEDDCHLLAPAELRRRLSALMSKDLAIKYKNVLGKALEEEKEANDIFARINNKLTSGGLTFEETDHCIDRLCMVTDIYHRQLLRYEGMGLHEWAEAAYEKMAVATTILQVYHFGGVRPIHYQVRLVFAALRFGQFDDFLIELRTLLTAKGYPRLIKRYEIGHLNFLIKSIRKALEHSLSAQVEAMGPDAIKDIKDRADKLIKDYFDKAEAEQIYKEESKMGRALEVEDAIKVPSHHAPFDDLRVMTDIDYSEKDELVHKEVVSGPVEAEHYPDITRQTAAELYRAFEAGGKYAYPSDYASRRQICAAILDRVEKAKELLPQEIRLVKDALSVFLDGKNPVIQFDSVVLASRILSRETRSWFLGFNTAEGPADGLPDIFSEALRETFGATYPDTIFLSADILNKIGDKKMLLREYLFSVIIYPYVKRDMSQYLRTALFPANYHNFAAVGDLENILEEVVNKRFKKTPERPVSEKEGRGLPTPKGGDEGVTEPAKRPAHGASEARPAGEPAASAPRGPELSRSQERFEKIEVPHRFSSSPSRGNFPTGGLFKIVNISYLPEKFRFFERAWGEFEIFTTADEKEFYVTPVADTSSSTLSRVEYFYLTMDPDLTIKYCYDGKEMRLDDEVAEARYVSGYKRDPTAIVGILKELIGSREELVRHQELSHFWIDQSTKSEGRKLFLRDACAASKKPPYFGTTKSSRYTCDFCSIDNEGALIKLAEFGTHESKLLANKFASIYCVLMSDENAEGTDGRRMHGGKKLTLNVRFKKAPSEKWFGYQAAKLTEMFLVRIGKQEGNSLEEITVEDPYLLLGVTFKVKVDAAESRIISRKRPERLRIPENQSLNAFMLYSQECRRRKVEAAGPEEGRGMPNATEGDGELLEPAPGVAGNGQGDISARGMLEGFIKEQQRDMLRNEEFLRVYGNAALKKEIVEILFAKFPFEVNSQYADWRTEIYDILSLRFWPSLCYESKICGAFDREFSKTFYQKRPTAQKHGKKPILGSLPMVIGAMAILDKDMADRLMAKLIDYALNEMGLAAGRARQEAIVSETIPPEAIEKLEDILELEIPPKDRSLFAMALTNERKRLTSLGDALLDKWVAEQLRETFTYHRTFFTGNKFNIRYFSLLTGNDIYSYIARKSGIWGLVLHQKTPHSNGRRKAREIKGDVFEAVLAAVYLSSGKDWNSFDRVVKRLLTKIYLGRPGEVEFNFYDIITHVHKQSLLKLPPKKDGRTEGRSLPNPDGGDDEVTEPAVESTQPEGRAQEKTWAIPDAPYYERKLRCKIIIDAETRACFYSLFTYILQRHGIKLDLTAPENTPQGPMGGMLALSGGKSEAELKKISDVLAPLLELGEKPWGHNDMLGDVSRKNKALVSSAYPRLMAVFDANPSVLLDDSLGLEMIDVNRSGSAVFFGSSFMDLYQKVARKIAGSDDKLREAIVEMLKNAYVHGNKKAPNLPIVIEWVVEPDAFIVSISDKGKERFDAEAYFDLSDEEFAKREAAGRGEEQDDEDLRLSGDGLGLYYAKKWVDTIGIVDSEDDAGKKIGTTAILIRREDEMGVPWWSGDGELPEPAPDADEPPAPEAAAPARGAAEPSFGISSGRHPEQGLREPPTPSPAQAVVERQQERLERLTGIISEYKEAINKARIELYNKFSPGAEVKTALPENDPDFNFVVRSIERGSAEWYGVFWQMFEMAQKRGVRSQDLESNGRNMFDSYMRLHTGAVGRLRDRLNDMGIIVAAALEILRQNESKNPQEIARMILEKRDSDHSLESRITAAGPESVAPAAGATKPRPRAIDTSPGTDGGMDGGYDGETFTFRIGGTKLPDTPEDARGAIQDVVRAGTHSLGKWEKEDNRLYTACQRLLGANTFNQEFKMAKAGLKDARTAEIIDALESTDTVAGAAQMLGMNEKKLREEIRDLMPKSPRLRMLYAEKGKWLRKRKPEVGPKGAAPAAGAALMLAVLKAKSLFAAATGEELDKIVQQREELRNRFYDFIFGVLGKYTWLMIIVITSAALLYPSLCIIRWIHAKIYHEHYRKTTQRLLHFKEDRLEEMTIGRAKMRVGMAEAEGEAEVISEKDMKTMKGIAPLIDAVLPFAKEHWVFYDKLRHRIVPRLLEYQRDSRELLSSILNIFLKTPPGRTSFIRIMGEADLKGWRKRLKALTRIWHTRDDAQALLDNLDKYERGVKGDRFERIGVIHRDDGLVRRKPQNPKGAVNVYLLAASAAAVTFILIPLSFAGIISGRDMFLFGAFSFVFIAAVSNQGPLVPKPAPAGAADETQTPDARRIGDTIAAYDKVFPRGGVVGYYINSKGRRNKCILSGASDDNKFCGRLASDIGNGNAGKKALSVGAGSGALESRLKKAHDLEVTCIDINSEFMPPDMRKSMAFALADGEHLPFADNSFDIVILSESIGHMKLDIALAEAFRVLKPGGVIHILTANPASRLFRDLSLLAALKYTPYDTAQIMDGLENSGFKNGKRIRYYNLPGFWGLIYVRAEKAAITIPPEPPPTAPKSGVTNQIKQAGLLLAILGGAMASLGFEHSAIFNAVGWGVMLAGALVLAFADEAREPQPQPVAQEFALGDSRITNLSPSSRDKARKSMQAYFREARRRGEFLRSVLRLYVVEGGHEKRCGSAVVVGKIDNHCILLTCSHEVRGDKFVRLKTNKLFPEDIGTAAVIIRDRNIKDKFLSPDITVLSIHEGEVRGGDLVPIEVTDDAISGDIATMVSGFGRNVYSGSVIFRGDTVRLDGIKSKRGDSGSPLIVRYDGKNYVIALHSFVAGDEYYGVPFTLEIRQEMLKALVDDSGDFKVVSGDAAAKSAVKKFLEKADNPKPAAPAASAELRERWPGAPGDEAGDFVPREDIWPKEPPSQEPAPAQKPAGVVPNGPSPVTPASKMALEATINHFFPYLGEANIKKIAEYLKTYPQDDSVWLEGYMKMTGTDALGFSLPEHLQAICDYVEYIFKKYNKEFERGKLVFVGGSADLIYAAARIMAPAYGVNDEDLVLLQFPTLLLFSDQDDYIYSYLIGNNIFSADKPTIFIDNGFEGHPARELIYLLDNSYNKKIKAKICIMSSVSPLLGEVNDISAGGLGGPSTQIYCWDRLADENRIAQNRATAEFLEAAPRFAPRARTTGRQIVFSHRHDREPYLKFPVSSKNKVIDAWGILRQLMFAAEEKARKVPPSPSVEGYPKGPAPAAGADKPHPPEGRSLPNPPPSGDEEMSEPAPSPEAADSAERPQAAKPRPVVDVLIDNNKRAYYFITRGNLAGAAEALKTARQLYDAHIEDPAVVAQLRYVIGLYSHLAIAYAKNTRNPLKAEEALRASIEIYVAYHREPGAKAPIRYIITASSEIASVYMRHGNLAKAEEVIAEASRIYEACRPEDPDLAGQTEYLISSYHKFAIACIRQSDLGRADAAIKRLRGFYETYQDDPNVKNQTQYIIGAYTNMAIACIGCDLPRAEEAVHIARQLYDACRAKNPDVKIDCQYIMGTYNNLAKAYIRQANFTKADECLRAALETYEASSKEPGEKKELKYIFMSYRDLGAAAIEKSEFDTAESSLQAAYEIIGESPASYDARDVEPIIQHCMIAGPALRKSGKIASAERLAGMAYGLVNLYPDTKYLGTTVAHTVSELSVLASVFQNSGNLAKAAGYMDKAYEIFAACPDSKKMPERAEFILMHCDNLAAEFVKRGNFTKAERLLNRADSIYREYNDAPNVKKGAPYVVATNAMLAEALTRRGHLAAAANALLPAYEILKSGPEVEGIGNKASYVIAKLNALAAVYRKNSEPAEAKKALDKAYDIFNIYSEDANVGSQAAYLITNYVALGWLYAEEGKSDITEEVFEKARKAFRKNPDAHGIVSATKSFATSYITLLSRQSDSQALGAAARRFEADVAEDPNDLLTLDILAFLYLKMGRCVEAELAIKAVSMSRCYNEELFKITGGIEYAVRIAKQITLAQTIRELDGIPARVATIYNGDIRTAVMEIYRRKLEELAAPRVEPSSLPPRQRPVAAQDIEKPVEPAVVERPAAETHVKGKQPPPRPEKPRKRLDDRIESLANAIESGRSDAVRRELDILKQKLKKAERKGNVTPELASAVSRAEGFLARQERGRGAEGRRPEGRSLPNPTSGGEEVTKPAPAEPSYKSESKNLIVLRSDAKGKYMAELPVINGLELDAQSRNKACGMLKRWLDYKGDSKAEHVDNIEFYIRSLMANDEEVLTSLYFVMAEDNNEIEGWVDLDFKYYSVSVLEVAPWNRTGATGGRRYGGVGSELRVFGISKLIQQLGDAAYSEAGLGRMLTLGYKDGALRDQFDADTISRTVVERFLAEQQARRERYIRLYGFGKAKPPIKEKAVQPPPVPATGGGPKGATSPRDDEKEGRGAEGRSLPNLNDGAEVPEKGPGESQAAPAGAALLTNDAAIRGAESFRALIGSLPIDIRQNVAECVDMFRVYTGVAPMANCIINKKFTEKQLEQLVEYIQKNPDYKVVRAFNILPIGDYCTVVMQNLPAVRVVERTYPKYIGADVWWPGLVSGFPFHAVEEYAMRGFHGRSYEENEREAKLCESIALGPFWTFDSSDKDWADSLDKLLVEVARRFTDIPVAVKIVEEYNRRELVSRSVQDRGRAQFPAKPPAAQATPERPTSPDSRSVGRAEPQQPNSDEGRGMPEGDKPVPVATSQSATDLLKALRKRLGLTQKEFGVALRPDSPLSATYICSLERGGARVLGWMLKKAQELVRMRAGLELKDLRKKLGLSQEELGKALRPEKPLFKQTISLFENSRSPVPDWVMEKVKELARDAHCLQLISLRESLGLSQEEFGKALRPDKPLFRQYISDLEGGKSPIPEWIITKAEELVRARSSARLKTLREQFLRLEPDEFGAFLAEAIGRDRPYTPSYVNMMESGKAAVPAKLMHAVEEKVHSQAGQILKASRILLGLMQEEFSKALADIMGRPEPISKPYLSQMENGIAPVPDEILLAAGKLVQAKSADILKSLRERHGITQSEFGRILATAMGRDKKFSKTYISFLENGREPISNHMLSTTVTLAEISSELVRLQLPAIFKAIRKKLGLTQSEFSGILATAIGRDRPFSGSIISFMETGREPVSSEMLHKLIEVVRTRGVRGESSDIENAFPPGPAADEPQQPEGRSLPNTTSGGEEVPKPTPDEAQPPSPEPAPELEVKAALELKRFAVACRGTMQLTKDCLETKDYSKIPPAVKAVIYQARIDFSDPALRTLKEMMEDTIMQYLGAILLHARLRDVDSASLLESLNGAERCLVELEELAAEGKLLRAGQAYLEAGVLDTSRVPSPKPDATETRVPVAGEPQVQPPLTERKPDGAQVTHGKLREESTDRVTTKATVNWKDGLHARPASTLATILNEIRKNMECVITLRVTKGKEGTKKFILDNPSKVITVLDIFGIVLDKGNGLEITVEAKSFEADAGRLYQVADIIKQCFEDKTVDTANAHTDDRYKKLIRDLFEDKAEKMRFDDEFIKQKYKDTIVAKDDTHIKRLLERVHELVQEGIAAHKVPDNAKILLSETLFNRDDAEHLRGFLGKSSLVKIASPKEIRNASINAKASRENLVCVIKVKDYDNKELWNGNHKSQIKAGLIILNEDLQGSRYLHLEAIAGLAHAVMTNDTDRVRLFLNIIFDKTSDMDDAALLQCLIDDPRAFADKVRFKRIVPFDDDELLKDYKVKVENFLVMA